MPSHKIIDDLFRSRFAAIESHLPPAERTGVRSDQRRVIESILDGRNTLALMPTGSGKSLCYWIAGLALKGITLVIFPLTALMDEQAGKLAGHGCNVFVLHSGISSKKQYDELIALYNSRERPDFIFVSPERLGTDGFLEFVLHHIKDDIKLVVIDEAHCISQWGFDFRPFYKEIPAFLNNVFGTPSHPRILGLTATLSLQDQKEICRDFRIEPDNIIKSDLLLRKEIDLQVVKVVKEEAKDVLLEETLKQHRHEKMLVYIDRKQGKRSVEDLCQRALAWGFKADYFHGDLSSEHKANIIERFKAGEITVVFATSAFGMGIDIPDIRGVIHFLLPESIEQYYQQIGRGGRDGKPSWAILFYSDKNVQVRKKDYIEQSFPSAGNVADAFQVLTNYEVGKKTFNYFGEESAQSAYHYLIQTRLVKVVCKGIQSLRAFEVARNIKLPEFEAYCKANRPGLLIGVALKTGQPEASIVQNIYRWVAEQKLKATKAPAKILVIESFSNELPEQTLEEIMADVAQKKQYRHDIFDDFVAVLEEYSGSADLHQAIGQYLGVDKAQLDRRYVTLSGDRVISKSEVIIANLLFERKISFRYEQPLTDLDGIRTNKPDFTVEWNGKQYFWEHWGMPNKRGYREKMEKKKEWYKKYFPGQLIETVESKNLSREAKELITQYFTR